MISGVILVVKHSDNNIVKKDGTLGAQYKSLWKQWAGLSMNPSYLHSHLQQITWQYNDLNDEREALVKLSIHRLQQTQLSCAPVEGEEFCVCRRL